MVKREIKNHFLAKIGNREINDYNLYKICNTILGIVDEHFKGEEYDENFTNNLIDMVSFCLVSIYFCDDMTFVDLIYLFIVDINNAKSIKDIEFRKYNEYRERVRNG